MVRFFTSLVVVFLVSANVYAKDFGVRGETFDIDEPHMIEFFKSKISLLEESGELDVINQAMVDKTKERIFSPPPVAFLSKAINDEHFYWDPTVTAAQDYLDHDGNVVVAKGTQRNPFDYVSLREPMVFIDGSDSNQVDYALSIHERAEHGAKIILVRGRPFDVMKQHKVKVYFDQKGILSRQLGLSKVPSLVTQDDKLLRIDEVLVK